MNLVVNQALKSVSYLKNDTGKSLISSTAKKLPPSTIFGLVWLFANASLSTKLVVNIWMTRLLAFNLFVLYEDNLMTDLSMIADQSANNEYSRSISVNIPWLSYLFLLIIVIINYRSTLQLMPSCNINEPIAVAWLLNTSKWKKNLREKFIRKHTSGKGSVRKGERKRVFRGAVKMGNESDCTGWNVPVISCESQLPLNASSVRIEAGVYLVALLEKFPTSISTLTCTPGIFRLDEACFCFSYDDF